MFTLEQVTKGQEESRGVAYCFLNLDARSRWVFNATLRPLNPQERLGTHCTGGWVGHRAGLDGCGESRLYRDSIPGPSRP